MKYLRQTYPASYPAEDAQDANEGEEEGDDDDDEEEGDNEEEEEEEFEDVMDTSGGQDAGDEESAKPKVMKKRKVVVGRLPVHQAVPGAPVFSLGVVQRFTETGEV